MMRLSTTLLPMVQLAIICSAAPILGPGAITSISSAIDDPLHSETRPVLSFASLPFNPLNTIGQAGNRALQASAPLQPVVSDVPVGLVNQLLCSIVSVQVPNLEDVATYLSDLPQLSDLGVSTVTDLLVSCGGNANIVSENSPAAGAGGIGSGFGLGDLGFFGNGDGTVASTTPGGTGGDPAAYNGFAYGGFPDQAGASSGASSTDGADSGAAAAPADDGTSTDSGNGSGSSSNTSSPTPVDVAPGDSANGTDGSGNTDDPAASGGNVNVNGGTTSDSDPATDSNGTSGGAEDGQGSDSGASLPDTNGSSAAGTASGDSGTDSGSSTGTIGASNSPTGGSDSNDGASDSGTNVNSTGNPDGSTGDSSGTDPDNGSNTDDNGSGSSGISVSGSGGSGNGASTGTGGSAASGNVNSNASGDSGDDGTISSSASAGAGVSSTAADGGNGDISSSTSVDGGNGDISSTTSANPVGGVPSVAGIDGGDGDTSPTDISDGITGNVDADPSAVADGTTGDGNGAAGALPDAIADATASTIGNDASNVASAFGSSIPFSSGTSQSNTAPSGNPDCIGDVCIDLDVAGLGLGRQISTTGISDFGNPDDCPSGDISLCFDAGNGRISLDGHDLTGSGNLPLGDISNAALLAGSAVQAVTGSAGFETLGLGRGTTNGIGAGIGQGQGNGFGFGGNLGTHQSLGQTTSPVSAVNPALGNALGHGSSGTGLFDFVGLHNVAGLGENGTPLGSDHASGVHDAVDLSNAFGFVSGNGVRG
ncbi:hypothetical protein OBBRIDRAFT_884214 [Obba rivulosa]|uniref:Uncharacterized protein n=1 Tax=Obba rivulosa TaxID=1052685 RepID=A0A8E2DT07_9APHY|nr:hypothetical protein OBBRIDRAFT_884214 [Obba rivulosa]